MSKPSTVYRCSDSGNAELFAALYKGRVLYDHLRGRWMIWNGVRWRQDDDGEIRRLASTVPRERRRLAEAIADDEVRRKVLGWSLQSESSSRLEAMLKLASSERIIADNGKSWDGQPMLLGCENGTLDLTTGKMLTSKPSMRVTRTTGVKFDPAAESPALLSTLEMMWPEQPKAVAEGRLAPTAAEKIAEVASDVQRMAVKGNGKITGADVDVALGKAPKVTVKAIRAAIVDELDLDVEDQCAEVLGRLLAMIDGKEA